MTKRTVIAMIDYDNVAMRLQREANPIDVQLNMETIANGLATNVATNFPAADELHLRLYGGWLDVKGRDTPRASWLLAAMPRFRTRINRLRVKPFLVKSIAAFSDYHLLGTYKDSDKVEQKMVDCMITVDAIHFASFDDLSVVLVSDDQDLVPAAVTIASSNPKKGAVAWLRKLSKPMPNDAVFESKNLPIVIW